MTEAEHAAAQPVSGVLLVVGTPIGNLADFSERGKAALAGADAIICEDTRRSGRLLQQLGLPKRPFLVANEHTEARVAAEVIQRIQTGERLALITDAGMPGVSDPGQRLIRQAIDNGCRVEVVPGPTAVVSALVLSGLSSSRFSFEGFLARKGKERATQLDEIAKSSRTVVFYESPKRIKATLRDLELHCGAEHQVALARELTKLHEQVVRGSVEELIRHFSETEPRGEFVIVVAARELAEEATDDELVALLQAELDSGSSRRDAVVSVVASAGVGKNRVYRLLTDRVSTGVDSTAADDTSTTGTSTEEATP